MGIDGITSELSMAALPDEMTVAMVQEISIYFETLMTKFPIVREELIMICRRVCHKHGLSEDFAISSARQLDEALAHSRLFLLACGSKKGGVHEQLNVTENTVREHYRNKLTNNDIFVLENQVWVRPISSPDVPHRDLYFRKGSGSIRYRMFIIMLRYRGKPLPSRWLFTATRKLQSSDVMRLQNNDFMEDLRFEIRDVERKLNVPYLATPDKDEGKDYICEGKFSFSLAIPMALANELTMPV